MPNEDGFLELMDVFAEPPCLKGTNIPFFVPRHNGILGLSFRATLSATIREEWTKPSLALELV